MGGIVGPLRDDGVFDVDGFFLAFAPVDGPALYSAPIFHAIKLAADDVDLSNDPILVGSVSQALVVLPAIFYSAGFRNLQSAGLVPTENVRDNLAHAFAFSSAVFHGGALLVVIRVGFRGGHVVGQLFSPDINWWDIDLG